MPFETPIGKKDRITFAKLIPALNDAGDLASDNTLRSRERETALGNVIELKPHEGMSNIFNQSHKKEGERAAVELIKKSIDAQLGAGAAKQIFQEAGLTGATKLKGTDVVKLVEPFNNLNDSLRQNVVNAERPAVGKWQQAVASGQPGPSKAAPDSLEALLNNKKVTWKVSESGSGGALLAIKPDGTGALIKIEGQDGAQKAVALSNVMKQAFAGGGGAFEVAGVSMETDNQRGLKALASKLKEMGKSTDDPLVKKAIEKHLENLAKGADQGLGVSKMDFVAGDQLNKLPLNDKAALLQTGQLANELGKAIVLCPMAGLCDHGAPNIPGQSLPTNLSNFMIDGATGRLAPIDFDTKDVDGHYGVAGAADGVEALAQFVQSASASQAGFDAAVDQMLQDGVEGQRTPLADAMKALTNPEGPVEGLISETEYAAVAAVVDDPAIKRKQAVELLKGVVDGLDYTKQNAATMKAGFAQAGHGMSAADMDRVTTTLGGLDLNQMKQNLGAFSTAQQINIPVNAALVPPVVPPVAHHSVNDDLHHPAPAPSWKSPHLSPRAGQSNVAASLGLQRSNSSGQIALPDDLPNVDDDSPDVHAEIKADEVGVGSGKPQAKLSYVQQQMALIEERAKIQQQGGRTSPPVSPRPFK